MLNELLLHIYLTSNVTQFAIFGLTLTKKIRVHELTLIDIWENKPQTIL